MAKSTFDPAVSETVIAQSVRVKGTLECSNDLFVDGIVNGSVRAEGNVTLGANAQVFGPITALSLSMDGQVKGNVYIKERLVLGPNGRLLGDVKTASLAVSDGAVLIGQISMPDARAQTADDDQASDEKSQPDDAK